MPDFDADTTPSASDDAAAMAIDPEPPGVTPLPPEQARPILDALAGVDTGDRVTLSRLIFDALGDDATPAEGDCERAADAVLAWLSDRLAAVERERERQSDEAQEYHVALHAAEADNARLRKALAAVEEVLDDWEHDDDPDDPVFRLLIRWIRAALAGRDEQAGGEPS